MAGERKERLPGNRATPEWIKQKVLGLIREDWSPKQISGYLKKQENIAVSHETIYKWIRRDKQNGGDLYKHCRHKLKHRKRPVGSAKNIPNRTSIRERPREADGSRFGDFEMDTVIGVNHSEAILTITERKTNYLMIKKLPILIVHGKKEQLKTGINLSGNTSRKRHHLKIIRMRISKKSGTNQTEDLEKN